MYEKVLKTALKLPEINKLTTATIYVHYAKMSNMQKFKQKNMDMMPNNSQLAIFSK